MERRNNSQDIERILGHYKGKAEVISMFTRTTRTGEEVLKMNLKLLDDFYNKKTKTTVRNHIEECTVYGKDSNHIEIKKKLKPGDIIIARLDYENTKHKFHDYILRDSSLVTPAIVNEVTDENDTLGNWM